MNQYSKWHTVTYLGLEVKYANVTWYLGHGLHQPGHRM